jgi:hypothetical protein
MLGALEKGERMGKEKLAFRGQRLMAANTAPAASFPDGTARRKPPPDLWKATDRMWASEFI